MSGLVARLREARICEHEPELNNDKLIGFEAANHIERLEAELAEANAKIIRAENIAVSVRWYMESFLSTFESATPKPKLKAETT